MEKIIKIKGNVKSENENGVLLLADEQCIFGIDELFDETDKGTLTWFLLDEKENQVAKKTGKWNEKLLLTIDKKLSGDYRYQLGASFKSKTKDKTYPSISIGGYCEPKIISAKTDLPQKTGYGLMAARIYIEAEGLNCNKLNMELDFAGKHYSETTKCVEGHAVFMVFFINTYHLLIELIKKSKKEIEKSFQVTIKDASGSIIKDSSGSDIVIDQKITITAKQVAKPECPSNNSILVIDDSSGKVESAVNGIIELEKIEILKLNMNVCNDHINDWNNKHKDLWILKDGTGYCHWLKTRDAANGDNTKPTNLPITFEKGTDFSFKATFNCLLPIENASVRVKDNTGNCIFKNKTTGSKKKGDKITLTFTASKPFNDIRYIKNFELNFLYSLDNKLWIPLKKVSFCLYVTWDKPQFNDFEDMSTKYYWANYALEHPSLSQSLLEKTTLRIKDNGKQYVCETLLYIGCKQCSNKNLKTEEDIALAVFGDFTDKHVFRCREKNNTRQGGGKYLPLTDANEGMGYWRHESAFPAQYRDDFINNFDFDKYRSVRYMLSYGMARCGEWKDFFGHLLLALGLPASSNDSTAICTHFAFYEDEYDSFRNYTKKLPLRLLGLIDVPDEINYSYSFAVNNAVHNNINSMISTSGSSPAQGNPVAQPVFKDHVWFCHFGKRFFDPSYGKFYTEGESNLAHYCTDNIGSVYLRIVKITPNPTKRPPYDVTNQRSSRIVTTNIHNYLRSDKNKFV